MLTSQDTYGNTFNQPIVLNSPTSNESKPALSPTHNIDQEGIKIRPLEEDYLDSINGPETFSHVALRKDTYTLHAGSKIEANRYTDSKKFQPVNLQQVDNRTTIIPAQTIMERETDAVTDRFRNISRNSLDYLLQEQQSTKASNVTETVGYIVWAPDQSERTSFIYDATTSDIITRKWKDMTVLTEFTGLADFKARIRTSDGGDTSTVHYRNLPQTTPKIKNEEEQSKDSEADHTTKVVD